jgi:hypothetical protein
MVSKLSRKLKNTPTDSSLVCSSVSKKLNREETLSASNKVLLDNIGEENQFHSNMERQNLRVAVYVLNMRGQPLMPTTRRKARILLKEGKAQVVRRAPFTIQLLYATGEAKQTIVLGIDAGYSIVGFSAVSEQKELLAGEFILRKDVSKKITERSIYRRTRRGKLWYRKPRFLNRVSSKKKGWFAPSITHKLESHIRLVEILKQLLPITKIIVEVASFDTQKLQNPGIKSIEYQQGSLFGFTVRNYLLEKWSHQCVYCKKRNIPLEIEHIIPKSRGGTDRINNLTISCRSCNLKKSNKLECECSTKIQKIITKIQQHAKVTYKAATFMTMMRKQLVERLNCRHTYGDHTKYHRTKIGLSKSHVNDAFVIAGGKKHPRSQLFDVKQIRRNNRSIQTNRKGFKPSIRKQRYSYQPNDLVSYNNSLYRVKGVFNYGKWIRLVNTIGKTINSNIKNVELIKYGKGLQFTVNSSAT